MKEIESIIKKIKLSFLFASVLFMLTTSVFSAGNDIGKTIDSSTMTGFQIMEMVYNESKKKNTRKAVVDMKIYDNQGRERVRYFNYWTKFSVDKESSLIKFFRPKTLKGTALLTVSKRKLDLKETDDVSEKTNKKMQWFFLPALKSVKQLTSSDKNKSFMGSDFTYSDIAGRKLSQDAHQLMRENDGVYYVESVPIDLDSSLYSKIRYIISKKYKVIQKALFYDKEGKLLKTLMNSKISVINGVNIVMYSEMFNNQTNNKTILNVQSMEVGVDIKDDLLSIKGLQAL